MNLMPSRGLASVVTTRRLRRRREACQKGIEAMRAARAGHRRGIQQHFVQHVDQNDLEALTSSLDKVRSRARPLRPGRVSS